MPEKFYSAAYARAVSPHKIMEEESTQRLIETLGEDYDRCYRGILKSFDEGQIDENGNLDADYEFHARQLIRAAFAYIEGLTFSVKCKAASKCLDEGIEITPQESYVAVEVDYDLDDKGEVVERPAQIKLTRNIRFAFALTERANKLMPQFDPSGEWWSCLREAIKVRNRLMHPRMPGDLNVTPDELIKTIKAKSGFEEVLHNYITRAG